MTSRSSSVDVLIPTCGRSCALAVTLTALCFQTFSRFRLVISDQTETASCFEAGEVEAVVRLLKKSHEVEVHRHLPRRGVAEQRHFLLGRSSASYALFLDDDLILEPWVLEGMVRRMRKEKCGFVGSAPIGLSYLKDVRPHEQDLELWNGPVRPEEVKPGTPAWARHLLHNAANLYHVQTKLGLTPRKQKAYRVAWVGGCCLYDREKLLETGGFSFWTELPPNHAGEDIVTQLRLMSKYGGCAVIPSGVYHQELPTTVPDRTHDAPRVVLGL